MTKMPKWKRAEVEAIEKALGAKPEICSRCHCTLSTFSAICLAELDEICEGFEQIETARQAHFRRYASPPAPSENRRAMTESLSKPGEKT